MKGRLSDSLGFVIGYTRRMIMKKLNDALAESEMPLTYEQFVFLLILINQDGEVTQQDMANLTGKDKSAVLRTVDILEKKGIVARSTVPGDRRKNTIVITRKCDAFFDRVIKIQSDTMDFLKEGIDPQELQTAMNVMYQIQKNASK